MAVMQNSPSADDSRLNISAALILILMASLEKLKECGEHCKQEWLNGCRAEEFTSSLAHHHQTAGGVLASVERSNRWWMMTSELPMGFPSCKRIENQEPKRESCSCWDWRTGGVVVGSQWTKLLLVILLRPDHCLHVHTHMRSSCLPEPEYCLHAVKIFHKTKEPATMEAVTSSPSRPGQRSHLYITLRIIRSSFSALGFAFLALLLAGLHHLKVSMSCF